MIKIKGEIGWDYYEYDMQQSLKDANGDIVVYIDSPGGSVFEGVKIYNLLKDYNKGSITVIIGALCASIATYIAMAADKIIARDNSTFMIHNAWSFVVGDYREFEHTASVLKGLTSLISKKYITKTGKTEKDIRLAMDNETWLFGEEIKEFGFCDTIKDESNNQEQNNKSEALALAKTRFSALSKKIKDKGVKDVKEVAALIRVPKDINEDKNEKANLDIAKAKLKLHEREIK